MSHVERDVCTVGREGDIVMVRDECGEEVARYGLGGDLLSFFPGLLQVELDFLGTAVPLNKHLYDAGKVFFFGFTPVE